MKNPDWLGRFNHELSASDAIAELLTCCASDVWATSVARDRPYANEADLVEAGGRLAEGLEWAEVLQALSAHPRIGERRMGADRESRWSREEQAAVTGTVSPAAGGASSRAGSASAPAGDGAAAEGGASPTAGAGNGGAAGEAGNGGGAGAFGEANRRYEERFGHVYLVCATGRTADDLLSDLNERLGNAPEHERQVVTGELAKIVRVRLAKLTKAGES